jgi:hypothetical protein
MEWLKNFITPVSERVRSPFYGSFIVSWIIINWEVIYALIAYDKIIKGTNKIDFIVGHINLYTLNGILNSLVYPILMASVYIFVVPIIDLFLFEYLEKNKQEKLNKKYNILKTYTVSGEKYIDLLLDYNKQKESLAELQNTLANEKGEIELKQNQLRESEDLIRSKEIERGRLLDKIAHIETIDGILSQDKFNELFIGRWVCKLRESEKGTEYVREEFYITGHKSYWVVEKGGDRLEYYELMALYIDNGKDNIRFFKRGTKPDLNNQFRYVQLKREGDRYNGTETLFNPGSTRLNVFEVVYMPINVEINLEEETTVHDERPFFKA